MRYGDLSHGFVFGEVFKGRQKYFVDKKESVHIVLTLNNNHKTLSLILAHSSVSHFIITQTTVDAKQL